MRNRFRWPLRRRPAARQRRLAALPAAHDQQVRAGAARSSRSTARAWRSSSAARRSSPAARARARATSANGSSRTTGWKRSSRCRSRCSTTPASAPTSGSSPTARRSAARARSSFSTPASSMCPCGAAWATSAARSARRRMESDQIAGIVQLYGQFSRRRELEDLRQCRFWLYARHRRAAVATALPDDR